MPNQVDIFLSHLGIGKWNYLHYVVASIVSSLPAPHALAGAFVVPRLNFTCSQSSPTGNGFSSINVTDENACVYKAEGTDGQFTEESCNEWDFDNSTFANTLTSEFNLVCDREHFRAVYMSLYMAGILVGSPFLGSLSDRFGRRITLLSGGVLYLVFSLLSCWLPNLPLLLICRFLLGIAHVPVSKISFILAMEMTLPEKRSIVGMMIHIPWSGSIIVFGGIAYLLRTWRWLLTATSLPFVVLLPAFWFVDESPHWLVVRGQYERALQVFKKAARWNNVTLPPDEEVLYLLKKNHKEEAYTKNPAKKAKNFTDEFLVLLKTPRIRVVSLVQDIAYFVLSTVYYGLSFSGGNLDVDIFSYVSLMGLVELPCNFIAAFLLTRYGRRIPIIACFSATGAILLLLSCLPRDVPTLIVVFALLGRITIALAYGMNAVYATELFPTDVRTRGISYSYMCSRIGSIVAPFITEYLGYSYKWAPQVVFGVAAVIAALATTLLWETLGMGLLDTIDNLENTDPKAFRKRFNRHMPIAHQTNGTENNEHKTEEEIQLKQDS